MKSKKRTPILKTSTLLIYAALFPTSILASHHVFAQEKTNVEDETLEHIEVKGTYKALSDAAEIKRNATQIVDAISAADIGKLPDTNIAEALQRVTGVTIGRDDAGDGTSFQIRGFSANSLTINGKGVVSDGFDNRENNLNALSSSLVKSIVVRKTPTADQIEGGSGGSVELTTFSPFDFDELEIRAVVEANDNSLQSSPSAKVGGLFSNQWKFENAGRLGVLLSADYEDRHTYSEGFNARYGGVDKNRQNGGGISDPPGVGRSIALLNATGSIPDHPAFYHRFADIQQREQALTNGTISGSIQWELNDDLNMELKASVSDYQKNNAASRLRINTQNLGGNRTGRGEFGVTLEPGATWNTLTRPTAPEEYSAATLMDNYIQSDGRASSSLFTTGQLATGNVNRSFLTSGIFLADSQNNNQQSPVSSTGQLFIQDKSLINVGVDLNWHITDELFVAAKFGTSKSETDNTNREMQLHLETTHPETGNRLYPSIGFDIRNGGDLPEYEILWREPLLDDEGSRLGGATIDGFSPNYLDPNLRNDLHRLNRLNKNLNRTRGYIDEFRLDFSWNVEFAGIYNIEFGTRYDKLENFKDRSDFRTPFVPGFEDNDADGFPDDVDGDGLPDGLDRRSNQPNRTLTSLINDPLVDSEGAFSDVTEAKINDFLVLREGMSNVPGTFPRQFWGTTNDEGTWDNFINSVYGGHSVVLNDLQTEKVFEDTTAFYIKFNFEYEVAGMPLTGNFGIRHGNTDGRSEAFIAHCNMPWDVDIEKTNIVRTENEAFQNGPLAEWEAAGSDPDTRPLFEPSFWDQPLSTHRARNRAADLPQLKNFCTTRDEPGGEQLALIFKDDPWQVSESVPASGEIRTGTPGTDGGSLWKDYLASGYEYSFTLPSLNLSLGLTEDMFVRFALYKTMARPGANDLSLDPANRGGVFTQGNPNLKPFETESMDLSWEWYMSETDSVSITYFYKSLLNQKIDSTDFNVALNRLVRQPINGGDGKVEGLELGIVHTLTYLPNNLQGFGVAANLSLVDSEQTAGYDEYTGLNLPVPGRSESTYNLQLFYENYGWSVRLAYNWRDSNLRGDQEQDYVDFTLAAIDPDNSSVAGQNVYRNRINVNPRNWNEDFGQLDFSVGYNFTDNLGVIFKATNITEEANRAFTAIPEATRNYNLAASFYRLGVNWRF